MPEKGVGSICIKGLCCCIRISKGFFTGPEHLLIRFNIADGDLQQDFREGNIFPIFYGDAGDWILKLQKTNHMFKHWTIFPSFLPSSLSTNLPIYYFQTHDSKISCQKTCIPCTFLEATIWISGIRPEVDYFVWLVQNLINASAFILLNFYVSQLGRKCSNGSKFLSYMIIKSIFNCLIHIFYPLIEIEY